MKREYTFATIVINYRSEARTIKFISEELGKCSLTNVVVVVNNGATESSTKVLSEALSADVITDISIEPRNSRDIFIIHNSENSGFARGNNLGVEFITRHFDVDNMLFSNNDIIFIDNSVVETLLTKLYSLPDVAIIGPRIIGLDGNCQSPSPYVPFWTEMVGIYWERFIPLFNIKRFDQNSAKMGYFYRVMGSFFIVKRDDFVACGGMDPNTFLFGEEVILSERMCRIGKRVYYLPTVSVLHEHGAIINRSRAVMQSRNHLFDSMAYYYRTYRGVTRFKIGVARVSATIYNWLRSVKFR